MNLNEINFSLSIYKIDLNICQYTCYSSQYDTPIGFVWVRFESGEHGKKKANILNCYTVEWARRSGVCRFLYNCVRDHSDIMVTNIGSDSGGRNFLENYGFKYVEDTMTWAFKK